MIDEKKYHEKIDSYTLLCDQRLEASRIFRLEYERIIDKGEVSDLDRGRLIGMADGFRAVGLLSECDYELFLSVVEKL